ncbi:NAD(P)/FAD-dependent oxidoreductase [Sporolactobacillus sp. THM19-2]|uniref:NAD(P)/FAD-dependent oxidoreductase n=1 Tax=Sporolactobacillus sp. THM19-2 TaxID=2511171 RepID=UPI00101F6450|nr:NAD(P)/FAD-dependent oxidoreductase [Sporolactobacillus sp. THM19-2]RYL91629.1 pyridine nucleotide-disulfide oxidoreductase [Sporolactobacillus sp. THM19-2]
MYDVAIIGGGPAGQSAAIFTGRADLKTLLLDNEKGLTRRALLKNHYGIEETSGANLVETGRKQAALAGTEFVKAQATNIEKKDGTFEIQTEDGTTYSAGQVILATGSNTKLAQAIGLKTKDGREKYVKTVINVDEYGHTSIDGIWAAGVAAGVSVHTIVTSGDGAKTAINLISELKGERYVDHDKLPR